MYENLSESPLYSSGTMKRVLQELKDLKFRLSKVEDEVATLHELVREKNHVRERRERVSYSLSPPRILDFVRTLEDDDLRWSHELPRNNFETDSKARSVAMMMNNQAWFGDVFLFEMMCQVRRYRPRENHWFNSIFPFITISRFHQYIQSHEWFHHTCVLAIGYSDLFRFQSLNDKRMKWLLHQILNHMRDYGAEKIKVLSIPPARQMMKNAEYLRLCQTNNRTLQNVTETHPGVDFINLDSFFLKNSDESFSYFENGEVTIEVLDNLLMKKVEDKFSIYVDPDTAQSVIDHITNYRESSSDLPYISRKLKGFESSNDAKGHEVTRFEDRSRTSAKRRREDSFSYESDFRLSPDYHSDSPPPGTRRESPRRNRDYRRPSPNKYSDYSASRKRDTRFNQNASPTPVNQSQSPIRDLREENLGHTRRERKYGNRLEADHDVASNKSVSFYSESANRSKRRDDEPYEERIVSKSLTEVRLVRYGERKSASPPPPPPWLKSVPQITSTSSKSDRWSPNTHSK